MLSQEQQVYVLRTIGTLVIKRYKLISFIFEFSKISCENVFKQPLNVGFKAIKRHMCKFLHFTFFYAIFVLQKLLIPPTTRL